jgi:ABC-type transport system involved in multi-copper enzyme maturation permease subunit
MTTIRLVLKQSRFELIVLLAAIIALACAMLYLALRLSVLQGVDCNQIDCAAVADERSNLETWSFPLQQLAVIMPVFAACILGVPIVGREIERSTAVLAWSIGLSRRRWLIERFGIIGAVLAAGCVLPALATSLVTAASHPGTDLLHSFADASGRGPIVIERAMIAFAVAVLSGALLGRTLPGVLVGLMASAMILLAMQLGSDMWLRAEAVQLAVGDGPVDALGDKVTEARFRDGNGRLLTYAEARASLSGPDALPEDVYDVVVFGVPGSRYPEVTVREALSALVVVGGILIATTAAVDRRRPY